MLEAMVALVIFSGAALAFYGLLNTGFIGLNRAGDTALQMSASRHAAEILSTINPMEQDSGQLEFDGIEIAWAARQLEPIRRSQTASGGRGHFEIGLYEIEVTLRERDRSLGTWQVRVPGHRKVRQVTP